MQDLSKRMTPEEALKIACQPEHKGKLKIFIGYAPGVGKTYAMLNEGNRRLARGQSIVLGYVESHGRADTDKQIASLEIIPRKKIEYAGKVMEEMDTEAIIKRRPTTVLVDELAHTNVPGSKNKKRYEDVAEILCAGINVISTLNVQHLESLNDTIKQITGVTVRETIPDKVLETADEIVAVDITVEALLNRLKRGDVYKKEQIDNALKNFFREGNLNALREIALRETAQEVDEELEVYMKAHGIEEAWQTAERILVCISPSPNGKKLIRRGALIAKRYKCEWFVVSVESTKVVSAKWGQKEKEELESHFRLARQLGAKTVILSGRKVSFELARFSKEKNVTQIVIGHSEKNFFQSFLTGSTTAQLLKETKNIAIHVIPTTAETADLEANWLAALGFSLDFPVSDYWKMLLMSIAVTLLNLGLRPYIGYQAVGFIYLLSVLMLSLFVSIVPIIFFAILSALIWNFFFIPPFGTFFIAKTEDWIMSITYIFTAIITGYLTNKIRKDERLLAIREARTETMYRIVSTIAGARDRHVCIEEVEKELAVILSGKSGVVVKSDKLSFDETLRKFIPEDEKELSVALWTFQNGKPAGFSTETLSFAKALYLPLKGLSETVGVVSYHPPSVPGLSLDEKNLLQAAANQLAIYLERELFRERVLEAQELKDSEKLHQTILDCISHEIRTPITSIIGTASALQDENISKDKNTRVELVKDIADAADRLNQVITNVLDMSRLSSGTLSLKKDWYDINELVRLCVQHLKDKLVGHKLVMEIKEDLPLVAVDSALFEQVLSNILLNAANYTPENAEIMLQTFAQDNNVVLTIADNGAGVNTEELARIFDKFYRVKGCIPGGTGLGLAIAKGIVEAHHGKIAARNRMPHGLEIKISLPIEPQPEMTEGLSNE